MIDRLQVFENIEVKNPTHVECGVKSISLDGVEIQGQIIPASDISSDEVTVLVVMG